VIGWWDENGEGCCCEPWAQRWTAADPGTCTNCGLPFVPYSKAREPLPGEPGYDEFVAARRLP
jgi:hypothetical protein